MSRHDERWRIELLRASGASLDSLAEKFGVQRRHPSALARSRLARKKASYLAGPTQLEELVRQTQARGWHPIVLTRL